LSISIGGGFKTMSTSETFTLCNVAIGKSNPAYPLDVQGQINATGLLINGAPLSTDIGGGFNASTNNLTYTLCNLAVGTSNPSTHKLDIIGSARITHGVYISSNNFAPYINMLKDPIYSGRWSNMGSWGMFQSSNTLSLATSHISSNYIEFVALSNDSSIASKAVVVDTFSKKLGIGKTPSYNLDVIGDINLTGEVYQNGFQFLSGPLASNEMVSSFQVVPVTSTVYIDSYNETQRVFELVAQGTLTATPHNVQVTVNGMKLAYIDSSNNDFTLSISNPDLYSTKFTITLASSAITGDIVDITVWPSIPDLNGFYIRNVDFASNIMFSNVGIGVSNPSYPLHVKNAGSSNWLLGLNNGNVQTLFCHSDGMGMKLISSNVLSTTSMLECINDSNMLFYLNNEGTMGLGTSNISNTYKLQVEGAINASGSVTSSSDERLKKDIIKIKDSLSIVEKLNGYKFNFINDKLEKTHIGLIAQEVEQVIPEVVYEDNHGFKSVAYGNIVALLIEAIKEQQVMINELKGKIQ
jgi:hypothetical protein